MIWIRSVLIRAHIDTCVLSIDMCVLMQLRSSLVWDGVGECIFFGFGSGFEDVCLVLGMVLNGLSWLR